MFQAFVLFATFTGGMQAGSYDSAIWTSRELCEKRAIEMQVSILKSFGQYRLRGMKGFCVKVDGIEA